MKQITPNTADPSLKGSYILEAASTVNVSDAPSQQRAPLLRILHVFVRLASYY